MRCTIYALPRSVHIPGVVPEPIVCEAPVGAVDQARDVPIAVVSVA